MTAKTTETPGAGSPPDLWGLGDDDAITGPEQDAFGRAPFARHLADVIRTAPETASFRVGLFGEWGEGKTSVMAMMERDLERDGDFVCVRVSAWDVRDARDVVRRVAEALSAAAGTAEGVGATLRAAARAAGRLGDVRKATADAHWIGKGLDALFGEAAERKAGEAAQWSAYREIAKAREALGDRRAVVFVDDLDRADASGLPRVLMALREAVPMEGLVFVLALSAGAVRSALKKSGYGLESPGRFLEKIIEFPAHVPPIARASLEAYAERRIREIGGLRNPEALRDMASLLPPNPRRLKRFLRTLAAFRRTFDRFDDGEIDWMEVYAAQLLLVEFPDQARRLRADAKTVAAMNSAYAGRLAGVPAAGRQPPEAKYAPVKRGRRRFLAICAVLRRSRLRVSRYALADVLSLDTAPPVVTFREARAFAQGVAEAAPEARAPMIARRLDEAGAQAHAVAGALWKVVLELRDGALDAGRLAHDPAAQRDADETAGTLTEVAEAFALDAGLFRDGMLGPKAWGRWYDQARVWAGIRDDDRREALRGRELHLAGATLDGAPESLLEGVYYYLQGHRRMPRPGESPPAAYAAAVDAIWRRVRDAMLDAVVARFARPDGTAVFASCGYRQHGKDLVFDPGSPLYRDEALARIEALADAAASGDAAVQGNCLDVLQQLAAATDGYASDVSASDATALFANARLLALLWRAASTTRMSTGAAWALAGVRERALAAPGVSTGAMPIPQWWAADVRAHAEAREVEVRRARPSTAGDAEPLGSASAASDAPGAFGGSPPSEAAAVATP